MGNADTKLHFRKAVLHLTTKTQPIPSTDEAFWSQFWSDHVSNISDVFVMLPAAEVRALRESAPSNLATLCYKAVERLVMAADTGASTYQEQQAVLNCIRILTRVMPYIFEDPDWRGFFWSSLPADAENSSHDEDSVPLAQSLINAVCDLLFCPDFTVVPNKKVGVEAHEDLQSLDSCEYIWEAGVGAAHASIPNSAHDSNRKELLKLLLTCCSQIIYTDGNLASNLSHVSCLNSSAPADQTANPWLCLFTSASNRHALPLFTSLLNTVCGYDPVGRGLPYNHFLFADNRESLVEVCLQLLITAIDSQDCFWEDECQKVPDNLFINYLSRIHREEDFSFVLRGFTRLLNNPLQQTYLPHSTKKVNFHQELLVFFWKFCDYNKKFLFYVLKSSEVLEILVPVLYHLNDARADHSRVGLLHVGVFILLLLSGERNFGVRLNKPYTAAVPMDIPVFTGSHADLMIIVFHKIITTGHQRLQPLFDCLLTILVNVSPYTKSLSMVAANKLLHLLEAFSTPWFLFSSPHHHHLIFFLLETFNNIIQYQFDGNSNLVYTIIRKRQVFHALANLPTDTASINRSLNTRRGAAAFKKYIPGGSSSSGGITTRTSSQTSMKTELDRNQISLDNNLYSISKASDNCNPSHMENADDDDDELADGTVSSSPECNGKMKSNRNVFIGELKPSGVTSDSKVVENASSLMAHEVLSSSPAILSGTKTCTLPAVPRIDKITEQSSAHPTTSQLNQLTAPSCSSSNPLSHPEDCAAIPHHLITAITPCREQLPALPETLTRTTVHGKPSEVLGHSDLSEIASSFLTVQNEMPLTGNVCGEATSACTYPPSPHLSTNPQPLARPSHVLGLQHNQHQRSKRRGLFISTDSDDDEDLILAASATDGAVELQETAAGDSPALVDEQKESSQRKSGSRLNSSSSSNRHPSSGTVQPTRSVFKQSSVSSMTAEWSPTGSWVLEWKGKLPLQTIMRLLQVLVPQVEKICIDKGLTDESEILRFLQHGTLVGLLPVPHPILIRKYQANAATAAWFRTYMWGVIYLRNVDPPIWYDTDVKLFEIQRV